MPDGRGRIAHLMLASKENDDLRYVGAGGPAFPHLVAFGD
jgi:hypothetical protein